MTPPGAGTVGKAVGQRLTGERPSPMRALLAAAVTGAVAAAITYRGLRK
jgi:hypothetical protein